MGVISSSCGSGDSLRPWLRNSQDALRSRQEKRYVLPDSGNSTGVKRILATVVADIEVQGEYPFEQRQCGRNLEHLQLLVEWLIEREVEKS